MSDTQDQEQPDDIRSALMSAVTEIEEKTPGSTGKLADVAKAEPVKTQTQEPKEKTEAKPEGTAAPPTPAKGPDGKFIAKDKAQPSQAAAKPNETSTESAKPGTEGQQANAAPSTWKPEAKAEWEKLSPMVRDEIMRREKDIARTVTEKATELNQIKSKLDEIEPVLGPRRAALTANYGSTGAALKRLFDLSDFAGSDAPGFIAWFAQQSNVDLKGLLQGQAAAPQVAPEVAALQKTITGLQSELQQIKGGFQSQALKANSSALDEVENEVDPSGQKLRPFWADLRDKESPGDGKGPLVAELSIVAREHPEWSQRQIAAEAYDRTVWKLSDFRSRVQSDQQKKAQEEAEAKQRSEAASRSRKFVTGQPPGPKTPANAPSDNVRDDIAKEFYARLDGGARL